jgi:hypothetical protein
LAALRLKWNLDHAVEGFLADMSRGVIPSPPESQVDAEEAEREAKLSALDIEHHEALETLGLAFAADMAEIAKEPLVLSSTQVQVLAGSCRIPDALKEVDRIVDEINRTSPYDPIFDEPEEAQAGNVAST